MRPKFWLFGILCTLLVCKYEAKEPIAACALRQPVVHDPLKLKAMSHIQKTTLTFSSDLQSTGNELLLKLRNSLNTLALGLADIGIIAARDVQTAIRIMGDEIINNTFESLREQINNFYKKEAQLIHVPTPTVTRPPKSETTSFKPPVHVGTPSKMILN